MYAPHASFVAPTGADACFRSGTGRNMLPQGDVFAGGDKGRRLCYTVTIDLMLPEPAYRLVPNAGLRVPGLAAS